MQTDDVSMTQSLLAEIDGDALARRMKALGHPQRLRIMDVLRSEPECVCHLEAALDKSQPYLSQQLRVLREAGLISDERDGTNVYYRVADDIEAWLEGVMGPRRTAPSDEHDRPGLPAGTTAGRIDGCPCPKCRAAFAPDTCEHGGTAVSASGA